MKKRRISLVLVLVMVLVLAGCGKGDRIAEQEAENDQVQGMNDGQNANPVSLTEWHFDFFAWSGNNGANITFTATPDSYAEGQTAVLNVKLEGEVVDTSVCEWDGKAYTANTDLNAEDGYCYYCVITDAYGNESEVELNTPKNPTNEWIINIETSLTSYCNMMVEESVAEGNTLTITSGYAQAQLPAIGKSGPNVTIVGTELILLAEGKEIGRNSLTLEHAEGVNNYGVQVSGVSFTIPAMEDDQQLELKMEVTLSDGQILTAPGGNWFANGGELFLVVG